MTGTDNYPLSVERLPVQDGGGFSAYALDLPGCMSDGETEAEARENGRSAVRDWLDEARRLGHRIPKPKTAGVQRATLHEGDDLL